ncbi:MAG: hypothetical protein NTY12_04480 [Candidatus Falkowbacteria bacterium]|nr:hypothetical protein [Candidatus Falkowbacteria bacterium]
MGNNQSTEASTMPAEQANNIQERDKIDFYFIVFMILGVPFLSFYFVFGSPIFTGYFSEIRDEGYGAILPAIFMTFVLPYIINIVLNSILSLYVSTKKGVYIINFISLVILAFIEFFILSNYYLSSSGLMSSVKYFLDTFLMVISFCLMLLLYIRLRSVPRSDTTRNKKILTGLVISAYLAFLVLISGAI